MQCPVCDNRFNLIAADFQNIPIYKCNCGMGASGLKNQDVYLAEDRLDAWDGTYSQDYVNDNIFFLDLIKKYSKGQALLDVGTGSGCLPYLAKEAGYIAEGTDISESACQNVATKIGIKMYSGYLEDLVFDKKYDVISMVHLLEHTDLSPENSTTSN